MPNIIHEILQLESEINQEKLKVKEAIKNGALFEEVKNIVLGIRALQKKLESCLSNQ